MQGLIIKKNANLFTVISKGQKKVVAARGNLKKEGIYVGDKVEFDEIIDKILPRKNLLIRPPLANLDKLFIVVAASPKPDFLLVDKLIVYCLVSGVEPILVINKLDIAEADFISETIKNYQNVLKIIKISAKNGEINGISENIVGICALAGQSAVGKSSLINSLLGREECEVGNLSKKVERGKQTTRMVELFPFEKGFLADTAGFSMLDLSFVSNLKPRELASYYPDFLEARKFCKFNSCQHKKHDKCGIIEGVKAGKISTLRYENYLKLLALLEEANKF